MKIYLLRHGDKAKGDHPNLILRHPDPPLSKKGFEQAQAAARHFAQTPLAAIYVSEYIRTHQTAHPLADLKQIQPIEDPRLNEIDNGDVDQMTVEEFKHAYPEIWKQYNARTADFRFPGGESGLDVRSRISAFMKEKLKLHEEDNILLVSHDGLIRVCMTYLFDIPVFKRGDFKVELCGLTQFEYQSDINRWRLLAFNKTIAE